jgi:drug/metabolite transporter (DMT)-like permease
MITTLLAALFLGEPARRETVLASLFAFAGVLVVLRPNFAALGWVALLPLICAAAMSVLMIGNRAVAGKGSALAMQFYVAAAASPLLLISCLVGEASGVERFAIHATDWTVIARCAVVACSATAAHFFIYLGTTRAGPATVAPMTYVQLIVALTLGWALFGERPDAMALGGAAMIVAAGLFLWWHGRVQEPAMTD